MTKARFILSLIFAIFLSETSFSQDSSVTKLEIAESEKILAQSKHESDRFFNRAIIQGLNKVTAKTSTLEIKVGKKVSFGQIEIIAHKCWQAPLDQKPESKILLEVLENNGEEVAKTIFYGWIFASSPSISGLEHAIYDLTAIRCKNSNELK
jgi:hypothetical protein